MTDENKTDDTDESLMARFQLGEESAFEILYDRYTQRLINFVHRFLYSREEAEDVAQQVLLTVYQQKQRFDSHRPFRPWLFAVASHLTSNRLRDKKRHPRLSLDASTEEDASPVVLMATTEPPMEDKELVAAVRRSLDRLPENQRLAITLARYENMSYNEIALAMKTSVSAIESLLFRARQSLKNDLSAYLHSGNQTGRP